MDTGSKKRRRSAGGLYPGLSTRESNTGAMVSCIEYLNILYIYIYIGLNHYISIGQKPFWLIMTALYSCISCIRFNSVN